jgi:chromosome segregation ATPase
MSDPQTVGESVGEVIEEAIIEANQQSEAANELAAQIAAGAMETERGNRIEALERRFEEWESNQSDSAQAIAALTMGMQELTGQMSVLLAQSTPAPSPTPNPQSAVDGQKESLEEMPPATTTEAVEVVQEAPKPAPAPKKKRRRWI